MKAGCFCALPCRVSSSTLRDLYAVHVSAGRFSDQPPVTAFPSQAPVHDPRKRFINGFD